MIPSSDVIKSQAVLVDELQSDRLIYITPRYDIATKQRFDYTNYFYLITSL